MGSGTGAKVGCGFLRGAFTLVEVLVATGIVVILAGLVATVYTTSVRSAKVVACTSSLKQIGLASALYLEDHGGQFPPYFMEGDRTVDADGIPMRNHQALLVLAYGFYGVTETMWFCPLDQHARTKFDDWTPQGITPSDHSVMSYMYGAGINHYRTKKKTFLDLKISAFPKPAQTVYLREKYWGSNGVFEYSPHGLTNNHLYMDGHVKQYDNKAPMCNFPKQNKECPD